MDNQYPPDSTYITGQRQSNRIWGTSDDFEPLNMMDLPRPEHTLDKDLQQYNPHLPQPTDMIAPPDTIMINDHNIPYNQYTESQPQQPTIAPRPPPIKLQPQRDSLMSILSNLFYNKIKQTDRYHHVMSSYSIYYLLLCLLVGTTDSSFTELASSMGITNSDILPALTTESIKLQRELTMHKDIKIQIINTLFINSRYYKKILQPYKNFMKKVGSVQKLDFSNKQSAINMINYWVKDITRGLIPNTLDNDSISSDTELIMMNIVYFKANWEKAFDVNSTRPAHFQQSTGMKVKVPMMNQKISTYYFSDSRYQLLTLSYNNPNFVIDFILPQSTGDFPVKNLHQFLESYTVHQRKQEVNVFIPRFKQENNINLVSPLREIGVNRIFDQYQAELFNMSARTNSFNRLSVSDIFQKVVMIVNETGTEAAAVSVATTRYNFSPSEERVVTFRADKTFQYCVRYVPTNTILFSGLYDGK